jgi:L-asparaginase II
MPSVSQPADPILATVTRSGVVESWHQGAVAVCHDGEPVLALGDVDLPVYCRSAMKPLQALPFLERGLADRVGQPAAELAVQCASHDGTPAHVAAVRSFLARGGFDEDQLGCGAHAPLDPDARRQLLLDREEPRKVHNNCSGKHTGFLHLARDCGDDLDGYLDPACRSQQEINAVVAAMAGVDGPVPVGVDGCLAPCFLLPLAALARAFARIANPERLPPARAAACRRIVAAAGQHPDLVAGPRTFTTALLRELRGRAFCKNGAEGVYAVALAPDPARKRLPGGIGIAVKVRDGDARGYQPVVVDLLARLGAFGAHVPPGLAGFHRLPVHNTQHLQVGEVASAIDWGNIG